ncbi:MAG: carboxypeptidase-like regulatory domain-containing protein [Gemmatimonadales bacterium]
MKRFRTIPGERSVLYPAIGLWLTDEMLGECPFGRVTLTLSALDGTGHWQESDEVPRRTAGGILTYLNLHRSEDLVAGPRAFRIVVTASVYQPYYLRERDDLEFDVHPFNDSRPPSVYPRVADIRDNYRWLLPGTRYPFPTHIRVVRGVVEDTSGAAVGNVRVGHAVKERVVTDGEGRFSVPIRWPQNQNEVVIDAMDLRSTPNRTGQVTVPLPGGLHTEQTIVIS